MSPCTHWILLLVVLTCQFPANWTKICKDIVNDIKIVKSCPTSKEEWDKAAYSKKCTDMSKRTNCEDAKYELQYHCVINTYSNETLEVCAPKRIIFGHCAEFNVVGGVIQRHVTARCNNVFPKCDAIYSSLDAYKYPDCYKLAYKNRDSQTTVLPKETQTCDKTGVNSIFSKVIILPTYAFLLLLILPVMGFVILKGKQNMHTSM